VSARLARLIVRAAAWLVPRPIRARWREEWLSELESRRRQRGRRWTPLSNASGAPIDALLLRVRAWSLGSMRFGWFADVRDAGRAIRKAPLQTTTIVLCLALGSTLTVLVFGVINAMLDGRLPGIEDRGRLVRVTVERAPDGRRERPRLGHFHVLHAATPSVSGFAAEIGAKAFSASAGGQGGQADGAFVSGSYFNVLGTRPAIGRLLQPTDDSTGAPPVAVISHEFWQRRFGGSPSAVGSPIQVTTVTFVIVGVAPAGFTGLESGEVTDPAIARRHVWMPMAFATVVGDGVVGRPGNAADIVARLSAGVARSAAETALQDLVAQMNASPGVEAQGPRRVAAVRLRPFHLLFADDDDPLVGALLIGALASVPLLVLGVACANVAGMQLARGIGRTHEMAVRVSLGAGRARVVRLLAIETGMLALAAAATAWLIARELLRHAGAVLPFAPIADARLLLFTVALPLAVTFAAGVLPAWRATGFDVIRGLRLGPRVGRTASPRSRRAVVALQMAVSIALLIGAGTLIRALGGLPDAIGPAHPDVLIAEVQLWDLELDEAREHAARRAIIDGIRGLPGVQTVGLSPLSIFHGRGSGGDGTCGARDQVSGLMRLATPEFFDVLGLRLLQGRTLQRTDDASVVVVNETLANRLSNPAAAVGSRLGPRQIVGVVADNYERFPYGAPRPLCYANWAEPAGTQRIAGSGAGHLTVFVRSPRAAELAPAVRALLRDVDPRLGPAELGTMPELVRRHYRLLLGLSDWLTLASVAAFAMAALGLFGIVAYGATLRTHEFGVRLALGARASDIGRTLVRESAAVVTAGAVIGLALAAPITWLMSQGLTSARMTDPLLIALALAALAAVSLGATVRPLQHVSRISVVGSLRAE
jgi:predicted permease